MIRVFKGLLGIMEAIGRVWAIQKGEKFRLSGRKSRDEKNWVKLEMKNYGFGAM